MDKELAANNRSFDQFSSHVLLEVPYSDEPRMGTARLSGTDELVAVVVDVELLK